MDDVKEILNRGVDGVEPLDNSYQRLLGRAHRRERRRRVGTALAALAVAGLGLGSVGVTLLGLEPAPRPGQDTGDAAPDLDALMLSWTATVEHSGRVPPMNLVQTDGTVIIRVESALVAFAKDCHADGSVCKPLWKATFDGSFGHGVRAADGAVYTGSNEGLLAFPADCTGDCEPIWRGALPDGAHGASDPIVLGNVVKVSYSFGELPKHVVHAAAFSTHCRNDGSVCQPLWRGEVGTGSAHFPTAAAAGMFLQQVGDRVVGFESLCGAGGADCEPSWEWLTGDAWVLGPAQAGDELIWTSNGSVYAFPTRCPELPCQPLWVGRVDPAPESPPVVTGDTVAVSAGSAVYAFPLGCRSDGGDCAPVWKAMLEVTREQAPLKAGSSGSVVVADEHDPRGPIWVLPPDCAASCEPAWRAQTGGGLSAVEVVGEAVLVGTEDGRLLAFPLDCRFDGDVCEPQWSWQLRGKHALDIAWDGSGLYVLGSEAAEPYPDQPLFITALRG